MIRFFSRQTVDSIIADITRKVEQLHAVKEAKAVEAELHRKAVDDFTRLHNEAVLEGQRALAIAEKLTSLVSP